MKAYRGNGDKGVKFHIGFEVLTATSMNITKSWVVTLCNPKGVHRGFGGNIPYVFRFEK
jgi:hypothetical protein